VAEEMSVSQRFVAESREHLATMTAALIALEREGEGGENTRAQIEQLLRSAHSIKGGAGFTGRQKIEQLAHTMETAVENLRDGRIKATADVIDALLAALDRIGGMVDDPEHSDAADISEPMARLRPLVESTPLSGPSQSSAIRVQPIRQPAPATAETAAAKPSEFPMSERVRTGWQQSRALLYGVKFDWFACEHEFGLGAIEVARRLEAVGAVLDSRVTLVGPALKEGLPTPPLWYHAIISSALDPEHFAQQLNIPGAAVVRLQNVSERVTRVASAPAEPRPKPAAAATSLRVSVPLIDRMMELSGELSLVRNQALRSTDPANASLRRLMRRLDSVTTELQDAALRMRMQPVGTLFDRFPRLVRDLARQLGKQIEITITGSEVELDKTVLEILADPLTHLFRNCCDHGIELPEQRRHSGKPPAGMITLSARQDRGQIVIEVRDDGKGLDPDAIKRKALQQGIKQSHELALLSEKQLYDLIMLSGFSTAASVTDLSGRGVGMDVVKTNLDQVNGTVEIDSAVGRGTCFTLRLPLTLAIMPCLLVVSGSSRYAIPQRDIEEIVLLKPEPGATNGGMRIERTQDEEVLRLRGTLVPLVRLSDVLTHREPFTAQTRAALVAGDHSRSGPEPPTRLYVTILRVGSHRFGLVVDNVLESEDIVVKPSHPLLRQLGVFVGATILGDGGIALILGIEGIARHTGILHRPVLQPVRALEAARGPDESQTLLLFKYGPTELLAMPLAAVQRVVRIRREKIERVGERELVNIDGKAVNLIRADRILNLSAYPDVDWFYLILPRIAKHAGLVASEIVDTPTLPVELDEQAYKVDGVFGSAMVRGQIAIFIDIDRLLQIWGGIKSIAPAQLPGTARRRILIVEDTQFFQRLIASYLESNAFEVTLAGNGSEGLEKLQAETFDLVISDIEMPGMNGFDFARRVRENSQFAGLPMLALTTLSDPQSRARAAACGFDAYEVKLDRGSLLACVHELLTHGRPVAAISGGPAHV
jgi:two-component system, chemotaxis family, sensor kinase CheA